jgi:polyisoprenoid-binding protein YceI
MKTMKISNLFLAFVASATLFSCSPSEKPKETTALDSTASVSYTVVTDSSTVNWKGTMVGLYSHYGTVKLAEGSLVLTGGKLTGGSFTVDLKSINPLDSGYSKEHKREDLIGHLGAPDFFATDSFPSATFIVKSVEGTTATGDLTVRGKTNEEKVTDLVVSTGDSTVSITGKLVFNRQKYGVAYKATMKDMVLSDDIEITVALKGKK